MKRKISAKGIYLDSNGTYYLKYKNKTIRGFKSVEEAEIEKARLRLFKDDVNFVKFSVVIKDYLKDQEARMKAEEITYGTYDKKEGILRNYITDELGDYKINQLTPKVLRDYRNSFIELKKSSVHKNYILQVLKSVFDYAKKYYGLNKDLSIYLDPFPKTEEEKNKEKARLNYIWTETDFKAFLEGMNKNLALAFTLMFRHGMRLGEVQALRYCDVDFKNKKIDINGSITLKSEERYKRKSTKTNDSTRIIFVGNTVDLIAELKEENKKFYKFSDEWYVCGNNHPITKKIIDRARDNHIKSAKLSQSTNHELRHMFVTNAWSAGVPITAISRYIGHKNISITLEIYSHLTQSDDAKLLEYLK